MTATSVTFFAPDAGEHGLLERQREIETLAGDLERAEERAAILREQALLDEQAADKQEEMGEIRQYVADRQQRVHAVQMDVLKLTQAIERHREQKARVAEQLAELAEEEEGEREREMSADERIEEIRDGLSRIRVLVAGARLDECERAVRAERERNADLDRMLREAHSTKPSNT